MMTSEERARDFLEHKQKYMAPLRVIDLVAMLDQHAAAAVKNYRQSMVDKQIKDWER